MTDIKPGCVKSQTSNSQYNSKLISFGNLLGLDENECENKDQCIDGTCVNNMGSFKCQCPQELTLHESGRYCEGRSRIFIHIKIKIWLFKRRVVFSPIGMLLRMLFK